MDTAGKNNIKSTASRFSKGWVHPQLQYTVFHMWIQSNLFAQLLNFDLQVKAMCSAGSGTHIGRISIFKIFLNELVRNFL